MSITPFKVEVSDDAIADLKERLTMARWPHATTTDWSRGQPVGFIRELADQWLNRFDWRAWETRLNAYPQFLTEIDGQTIHFLHIRSKEPGALPLILTHGWPSSVIEFFEVIGPLSDPRAHGLDPAQAFDLVIPSLPGYGWSTPLASPGWDTARVARTWDTLMRRLGYTRYGAQGGDIGSLVGKELGILAPEGLVGTHLQQIFAFPTGAPGEMEKLTPFEKEGFANLDKFSGYNGYQDIQSKRPGTLGYGLVDSPVGQLAWNTELFFGFEGEGVPYVDRDRYLAHVSIYWFTASGGSAGNIYLEDVRSGSGYREARNVTPTGVAVFPWDFRSVRSFAERANNIVHWTEMPRGGHFAATDAPDLLIDDIRAFFGGLTPGAPRP
ncbi:MULTISPECIES: epoxide hydrolase family protein [unclassified Devosia]|jgi:pimeloyl-ACP methyl ester carboxylesterase|uniref:epoxide hydrolase family protein n=1 Tax=unclassified Devosia TaxID=196773 RepID=UPI00086D0077|nr:MULTISPECIES: epoxide hydrolase family protein [unclassified Devosia]MBN9362409.1 epoxide hydrolase [Devosia sp.]ODS86810.1 MAG: epoxide hydrolase [Devosia sp. SCN 66-27]OJX24358.1 MAG: epoxide hydrolase [Devosia sp. 66-14]